MTGPRSLIPMGALAVVLGAAPVFVTAQALFAEAAPRLPMSATPHQFPQTALGGQKSLYLEYDFVSAVAFFPDGKTLASAGWNDRFVWLHDLTTGKRIRRFLADSQGSRSLAVSPDGKLLADGATVWDVGTGKEVFRIQEGSDEDKSMACLAFSPDGKTLALGNAVGTKAKQGSICLWDQATGKLRLQLQSQQRSIQNVDFSPDGTVLLSLGYENGNTICLWDVKTGNLLRRLDAGRGELAPVVFSPDGSLLAVGGEVGPLRLFDSRTGKVVRRFEGPDGMIQSIVFSADGRVLATASGYMKWHIDLLEVATGKEIRRLRTYDQGDVVGCVAFSADGKKLAMTDRGIRVLESDAIDLAAADDQPSANLEPTELETLWADLGGHVPIKKAYRAMWALGAGPAKSVPFLQQRLRPVPPVDAGRLNRLIADLDSDRFETRQKATEEIEALGSTAEGQLRRILAGNPSLELRSRIDRLLAVIESQVWSADELPTLRALQVLEHIGTPEARGVLETIAKGAEGVRRTVEAKASLARLARRDTSLP